MPIRAGLLIEERMPEDGAGVEEAVEVEEATLAEERLAMLADETLAEEALADDILAEDTLATDAVDSNDTEDTDAEDAVDAVDADENNERDGVGVAEKEDVFGMEVEGIAVEDVDDGIMDGEDAVGDAVGVEADPEVAVTGAEPDVLVGLGVVVGGGVAVGEVGVRDVWLEAGEVRPP
ncbi:hypothetical protein HWV62_4778 [Athelia sp. TMB]|nr:hypothetical protein HWV62_4778 [Athelia sp. TMB]